MRLPPKCSRSERDQHGNKRVEGKGSERGEKGREEERRGMLVAQQGGNRALGAIKEETCWE
jgi:hypothetical protein